MLEGGIGKILVKKGLDNGTFEAFKMLKNYSIVPISIGLYQLFPGLGCKNITRKVKRVVYSYDPNKIGILRNGGSEMKFRNINEGKGVFKSSLLHQWSWC